jgi:hypothetical protein
MTRAKRKSPRKAKPARKASPTRAVRKRITARKPSGRARRTKPAPARDPLDALIAAGAAALALPLDPAWRPAIKAHLKVTLDHAALVDAFALADDAEPAPVFRA